MGNLLKWFLIIVAVLAIIAYFAFQRMKVQTKQASPEDTVTFASGELLLEVTYSRPYKRGRDIFGGLVPYEQVWRTGANEATTFSTNQDLTIGGGSLPAGTYTLWTIPRPTEWTVIFNERQYSWGVNFDGTPAREPAADVATANVPVQQLGDTVQQFTIRFSPAEPAEMIMEWDLVRVTVPIGR